MYENGFSFMILWIYFFLSSETHHSLTVYSVSRSVNVEEGHLCFFMVPIHISNYMGDEK